MLLCTKIWSSYSCVICGPKKDLSLSCLFWEIFVWNRRNFHFIYPSLLQTFLSYRAWCAMEANRFFTFPSQQDMILLTWSCFWMEWPLFFSVQSLARLSHSHKKEQNIMYTLCSTVSLAVAFGSAHIPPVFFIAYDFTAKPIGALMFL